MNLYQGIDLYVIFLFNHVIFHSCSCFKLICLDVKPKLIHTFELETIKISVHKSELLSLSLSPDLRYEENLIMNTATRKTIAIELDIRQNCFDIGPELILYKVKA